MNKFLVFLFFLSTTLALGSCNNDDDNSPAPEIDQGLYYDGPNATAPILPGGTHEAAARFPAALTGPLAGKELTTVYFFMLGLPQGVQVKIYGQGNNNFPGQLLYTANIRRSELNDFSWNEHVLTTPLELSGSEIWISIRVVHNNNFQSIGCDSGPRDPNGDWLLLDGNNQWTTYQLLTNGESINWNIRAKVEDK